MPARIVIRNCQIEYIIAVKIREHDAVDIVSRHCIRSSGLEAAASRTEPYRYVAFGLPRDDEIKRTVAIQIRKSDIRQRAVGRRVRHFGAEVSAAGSE